MKLKKLVCCLISICILLSCFSIINVSAATIGVEYQAHIQDIGWQSTKYNGATAGTTGQAKRMEAIAIGLSSSSNVNGSISYSAHVANIGWQGYKSNGFIAGTTGRCLAIEAIKIKLTGNISRNYSVSYRVHMRNIGWGEWVYDDAVAGTTGQSRPIEAIQIKIVNKVSAPVVTNSVRYPMTNTYVCGNDWGTYYSARPSRPYHAGIDVASQSGDSNVYSFANGTIAARGFNSSNGNFVIIKHQLSGKTIYSFYAHLSSISVSNGQSVSCGQKIGVFGNTGSSSAGRHLHFAIVDTLWTSGGYYGYITNSSGNARNYSGVTYYNPHYVITYNRLP